MDASILTGRVRNDGLSNYAVGRRWRTYLLAWRRPVATPLPVPLAMPTPPWPVQDRTVVAAPVAFALAIALALAAPVRIRRALAPAPAPAAPPIAIVAVATALRTLKRTRDGITPRRTKRLSVKSRAAAQPVVRSHRTPAALPALSLVAAAANSRRQSLAAAAAAVFAGVQALQDCMLALVELRQGLLGGSCFQSSFRRRRICRGRLGRLIVVAAVHVLVPILVVVDIVVRAPRQHAGQQVPHAPSAATET